MWRLAPAGQGNRSGGPLPLPVRQFSPTAVPNSCSQTWQTAKSVALPRDSDSNCPGSLISSHSCITRSPLRGAGRYPTSREEPVLLAIVLAMDETHELTHAVAVEVWGAECVGSHHPPSGSWENHNELSGKIRVEAGQFGNALALDQWKMRGCFLSSQDGNCGEHQASQRGNTSGYLRSRRPRWRFCRGCRGTALPSLIVCGQWFTLEGRRQNRQQQLPGTSLVNEGRVS